MTNRIIQEAKALHACSDIDNIASLDELAQLLFESYGIEFCGKNNFPSVELLKELGEDFLSRHNVFVNSHDGVAINEEKVAVFGDSKVYLEYNDPNKGHVVFVNGGKVHVRADNWAVVFIYNYGGEVTTDIYNNAKVL